VLTARIVETRGELVGALMVRPEDEVFAITSAGGVIRTAAAEIKQSGRQTMGVRLMNLAEGQSLVAIARNAEAPVDDGDTLDTGDAAEAGAGVTAGTGDAPEAGDAAEQTGAAGHEAGDVTEARSADAGQDDPVSDES
jgi:hypothetical protein